MTNKVVILGSTNVDQFLTVERYAQPGETLHVEEAQKAFGGGKGANQAYCHCTHASRHNIYY